MSAGLPKGHKLADNLIIKSGHAEYYKPAIQEVIFVRAEK